MSMPDDVLGSMRQPLEEMRQGYNADPGKPWEERRESFLHQLGLRDASQDPVVRDLLERLDQTPEDERNKILGSDELESMAYAIALQHAVPGEGAGAQRGGAAAPAYDEQAWQAFLTQNGPQWDGTDASWEQFRQWFAYHAGQQGLGGPATALLGYLDTQPAAERITTFAQYGVTIAAPQTAVGGDGSGYDEQAWQAYLTQNGPQWDGTDACWDQFRQWFAYHAGQQGLGGPATALLGYLATQPAAERITTFAQYGVTIAAPQTAQPADAELSAEEIESLIEDALTDEGGPEAAQPAGAGVAAGQVDAVGGDALQAHPELADVPDEERIRVMSEVLDDIAAG